MAAFLSAEELFGAFPSNEISRVVALAGLPAGGSKLERVCRLVDAGRQARAGARQFLSLFRADALRGVCSQFGLTAPTKEGMIVALGSLLGGAAENLALETTDLVDPTLLGVAEYLSQLVLPWRLVRDEADAEGAIAHALRNRFTGVSTQYSVGGYLGYRIDIALGDGDVGVEVKMAECLISSSGDAYRALGQAIVYRHRRFAGNLLVALVGPENTLAAPALKEVRGLLEATGAAVTYVRLR